MGLENNINESYWGNIQKEGTPPPTKSSIENKEKVAPSGIFGQLEDKSVQWKPSRRVGKTATTIVKEQVIPVPSSTGFVSIDSTQYMGKGFDPAVNSFEDENSKRKFLLSNHAVYNYYDTINILEQGRGITIVKEIFDEEKTKSKPPKLNKSEEIFLNYVELADELAVLSLKAKYKEEYDETKSTDEWVELSNKYKDIILKHERNEG